MVWCGYKVYYKNINCCLLPNKSGEPPPFIIIKVKIRNQLEHLWEHVILMSDILSGFIFFSISSTTIKFLQWHWHVMAFSSISRNRSRFLQAVQRFGWAIKKCNTRFDRSKSPGLWLQVCFWENRFSNSIQSKLKDNIFCNCIISCMIRIQSIGTLYKLVH